MTSKVTPVREKSGSVYVQGYIHQPAVPNGDALVFTHGAGGNSDSTLLKILGDTFAGAGYLFLRCDLPFRHDRRTGPPRPGDAARDREGLEAALHLLRPQIAGRLFLGGQSYGGRQATMLLADKPELAGGLVLTSYPLHPPGKPTQLRTQHFPKLHTPALFVEGSRDPFASMEEMQAALKLIPARTAMITISGGGHDLIGRKASAAGEIAQNILNAFQSFFTNG